MISLAILVSLALIPFAATQSTDPAFQIEAIEAHFTAAGIVPSLLATFDPTAVVNVNFASVGNISPGQALTQDQVGPTPSVTVTAANSSIQLNGNYTLAMVDAGPVGSDESQGVTRHWLVNSVTISSSAVSNASATAITQYAGPAPPAGTGPHRYVIILYAQPSTFTPPSDFSQPNIGVSVFDLNAYVKDSGLGSIIGATYFTVEEGQATASLSPTTAIVSSTLAPVSSAKSSSTSASGSSVATSAPSTTPNSASGSKANNAPFVLVLAALMILVIA